MSELRASLYTAADLSDPKAMALMWELLSAPPIGATKFDRVERARRVFGPGDFVEAASVLGRYQQLFVRGGAARFLASFAHDRSGCRVWDFAWRVRDQEAETAEWVTWLSSVCNEFPPLFGDMCTQQEYAAKHAMLDHAGKPSMLEGSIGVGTSQLRLALPGIYWWTVFGHEVAADLGLPQVTDGLNVTVNVLSSGTVTLQLNEPLTPVGMEQRLQLERTLASALGDRYFFDRAKPSDTDYGSLPHLRKRLDELSAALSLRLSPEY